MYSILQCLWTSHFPRKTNFVFYRRRESKTVCNNNNKTKTKTKKQNWQQWIYLQSTFQTPWALKLCKKTVVLKIRCVVTEVVQSSEAWKCRTSNENVALILVLILQLQLHTLQETAVWYFYNAGKEKASTKNGALILRPHVLRGIKIRTF